MLKTFLHGKIHRARVTATELDYEGSLSVDEALIAAPAGSGVIQVNGSAAHLCEPDDLVIIFAYGLVTEAEAATLTPKVVFVDAQNRPV